MLINPSISPHSMFLRRNSPPTRQYRVACAVRARLVPHLEAEATTRLKAKTARSSAECDADNEQITRPYRYRDITAVMHTSCLGDAASCPSRWPGSALSRPQRLRGDVQPLVDHASDDNTLAGRASNLGITGGPLLTPTRPLVHRSTAALQHCGILLGVSRRRLLAEPPALIENEGPAHCKSSLKG